MFIEHELGPEANFDPSNMRSDGFTVRHNGANKIAGLESEKRFRPRLVAIRKAIAIRPAHLARAVPGSADQQWPHSTHAQQRGCAGADIRRIQPVTFRQAALDPVELGLAARADFDRKIGSNKLTMQCPAC